jgi:tetratricopeptide (TPR) repeat protein
MKSISFSTLQFIVVIFFSACSSNFKPLTTNYITSNPQPLELVADTVPITISATLIDVSSENLVIAPAKFQRTVTDQGEFIGQDDDLITESATYAPQKLTVEELLYAATLVNAPAVKENLYKKATNIYPSDYRAFNNLGVLSFRAGKIADAEANFNKALSLSANAPETNLNLGLVALTKGNYSQAVSFFGDTTSNNAALAQILTKDYIKALSTLNAVKNPNAVTFYLKAIIASRTNNLNDVVSNLTQVIQLDASLANQVAMDLEFVQYFTNQRFIDIIK